MNKWPDKRAPDKTVILHWIEDQRAWAELPWADWVRFRGFGKDQTSLLAGAPAGSIILSSACWGATVICATWSRTGT